MSLTASQEGREKIIVAFNKLLNEHQQQQTKVATKEEELRQALNQKLLTQVNEYTVNNIVNSMAALQLDFSSVVNELTSKLNRESNKLTELKQAIIIEQQKLEQLRQIKLVADALHLLKQEHQRKIYQLEIQVANQKETLAKEITQTKKQWKKEQEEFSLKVTEAAEILKQNRQQEEADYQYEITRQRQIELDDYQEDKRQQERELAEIAQQKEQDWQAREKYLIDYQKEWEVNQQKIAIFEEKLKEETNIARAEAIKEADKKAKIQLDLLDKEWEANQQGYELKIQVLETTLQKQTEQINELTAQLQEVNSQAQNLALKAFQTNAN
jgi:hypothetical protein